MITTCINRYTRVRDKIHFLWWPYCCFGSEETWRFRQRKGTSL